MDKYASIVFQTAPGTFKDDQQLLSAIVTATGNDGLQIKRENYEDGSWSTWFSLTSTKEAVSLKDLALSMTKVSGLQSIMLKTDKGAVEPLQPLEKFRLGAWIRKGPSGPK